MKLNNAFLELHNLALPTFYFYSPKRAKFVLFSRVTCRAVLWNISMSCVGCVRVVFDGINVGIDPSFLYASAF